MEGPEGPKKKLSAKVGGRLRFAQRKNSGARQVMQAGPAYPTVTYLAGRQAVAECASSAWLLLPKGSSRRTDKLQTQYLTTTSAIHNTKQHDVSAPSQVASWSDWDIDLMFLGKFY